MGETVTDVPPPELGKLELLIVAVALDIDERPFQVREGNKKSSFAIDLENASKGKSATKSCVFNIFGFCEKKTYFYEYIEARL
jgi:hypothetical protein